MEGILKDFAVLANRSEKKPHPAKFNDALIEKFSEVINEIEDSEDIVLLDVFGGVGKLGEIKSRLKTNALVLTSELEEEWAYQGYDNGVDIPLVADSTDLPVKNSTIDFVVTSPTYGNRMADSHVAKDGSKRNTYTHKIGRKLNDNNTGKMQWGKKYREIHSRVYDEVKRVLKNNGFLLLNMKDHIRKGERVRVTDWHIKELQNKGFTLKKHIKVPLKGNGFGANSHLRVPYESVILFQNNKEEN